LTELGLNGDGYRKNVTDAGLKHIAKLTSLKQVWLLGCDGVTDNGVAELRKALPKCQIDHSRR
jgi:hypothetical protein